MPWGLKNKTVTLHTTITKVKIDQTIRPLLTHTVPPCTSKEKCNISVWGWGHRIAPTPHYGMPGGRGYIASCPLLPWSELMYYKDKQIWLEGPAWDFNQLNLKFGSENRLKILNFVEEFKNTSNPIESHSGRCQKNHICLTYQILVYSNHCNWLTPGLQNA